MRRLITALILLCACGSTTVAQTTAAPPATPTPAQESPKPAPVAKNDYSNGDNWLCRPGRQDACDVDLSTTVITADGKMTLETWAANPNA
ncbi:MAG: hypothetical protein ABSF40_16065, partial [Candidatus Acidiferrales bacterium]